MIYKFQQFKQIDKVTISFIDGAISEKEYRSYIESEILNESLGNYIKEKITNVLYTFITKASSIGFSILNKFKSFFTWLLNKMISWKEKHPVLHKILITTTIIVILLIVSSASAYAQTKGTEVSPNHINVAIGWLEVIQGKTNQDPMLINKAMAHLIDIRDGQIDIPNIGQDAINIADAAISTANKMIIQAKDDDSLAKMCIDLMERGLEYVQAIYKKMPNKEVITLSKS